jgi:nitronate monooxygenase
VDFVITSLGSPKEVIEKCKPKNIKVFCDVIDVAYAKKCEELGADALIAVSQEAGGHFGPIPARELIALLKSHTNLPIISAGGIGSGQGIWERIHQDQVIAVSIGSIFIASEEAPISQEYKQACVDYKAEDIVTTTKISGSPLSVINTDYVKKIGTEQNLIEKWLSKSKRLKKYVKMFTMYMGMRKVQKAAFSATYQNVWVAGKSIDFIHSIRKVSDIIAQLIEEYENYNKKNSALKQQN